MAPDLTGNERNGTVTGDGDQPGGEPPPDETPTAAVRLGWRIAELCAGVDDTGTPADDGALGIRKASVLVTVRTRLHQWSELLWNRALAKKVRDRTLVLDSVLDPPAVRRRSLARMAAGIGKKSRESVTPHPRPMGAARASF